MAQTPTYVVVGPQEHGVTRHALALAGAGDAVVRRLPAHPTVDALLAAADGAGAVHLHLTDHLLAGSPAAAADLVEALADRCRTTLTLHDVPQPAEGAERYARRARAYGRMRRAAAVCVVASEHESEALERCGDSDTPIEVVPLPVERNVHRPVGASAETPSAVAVLGFVYPGKGHLDVLAAMRDLPAEVGLDVLGAPSPGHDGLLDELAAGAAEQGRRLRVTGYVEDADLAGELTRPVVPVLAHRHASASGSAATWIGHGRRPVALDGGYARELAARYPWAVTVVDDLAAGMAAALSGEVSTWIDPGDGRTAVVDTAEAARLEALAVGERALA